MSNESKIHIQNTEVLTAEIYQFLNDLSPPIMSHIFWKQESYYSLRNPSSLVSERKFTTTCGIETISFRGPQICQDLSQDTKILINLTFSNLIWKNMKPYLVAARYVNLLFFCSM